MIASQTHLLLDGHEHVTGYYDEHLDAIFITTSTDDAIGRHTISGPPNMIVAYIEQLRAVAMHVAADLPHVQPSEVAS